MNQEYMEARELALCLRQLIDVDLLTIFVVVPPNKTDLVLPFTDHEIELLKGWRIDVVKVDAQAPSAVDIRGRTALRVYDYELLGNTSYYADGLDKMLDCTLSTHAKTIEVAVHELRLVYRHDGTSHVRVE